MKPSFSEADERLCEQQLLVRWPPRERTDEIAASVKRREKASAVSGAWGWFRS